jgi:hypothetical protein
MSDGLALSNLDQRELMVGPPLVTLSSVIPFTRLSEFSIDPHVHLIVLDMLP